MHHVHDYKVPLPIVQKQVGHKTLKATSVYLKPSDEAVAEAYADASGSAWNETRPGRRRELGGPAEAA